MSTYVIPLLAFIALCAGWAVFQLWLAKTDPETAARGNRCGGCNANRRCQCDGK